MNEEKKKYKRIMISLPLELYRTLKLRSAMTDMPMSVIIQKAIKHYFRVLGVRIIKEAKE